MLRENDAVEVLARHLKECEEDRSWRQWHRNAYATDFWAGNHWSGKIAGTQAELMEHFGWDSDGIPVKLQVNQVEPFVSGRVANLFYRNPTTTATAPRVLPPRKRGRPRSMVGASDAVTGYLDDWLLRSDVKEATTYGYQMALMYGHSAFKLGALYGERVTGSALERVWVDTLPPWEVVLDRRARNRQTEAYRGHFRWELIEDAREIVEDNLDGIEPVEMPDYLVDGYHASPRAGEHLLKLYVPLLELYDIPGERQCFYVATSLSKEHCALKKVGKDSPIPYTLPSGRPGVPIEPIILSNLPEYPLHGLSAVKRIYQLNAEDNLMLSIVVSAMRRDAARVILYLKSANIDQRVIEAIESGRDLTLVGIDHNTLQGIFQVLTMPTLAPTLDKAREFVDKARQEASASSEFMQGKQLKYATAEEARHVAAYGELSVSEVGDRMAEALARTTEFVLAITAAEMDDDILISGPEGDLHLTKDIASLSWTIGITDSASTPTRDLQRKAEWAAVKKDLVELIGLASAPLVPQGQVDPTVSVSANAVSPQVQRMAQEMLNYLVKLYQLPDSMSWDAIAAAVEPKAERKDGRMEEARALLQRLVPALAAQRQSENPQIPAMPQGTQAPPEVM